MEKSRTLIIMCGIPGVGKTSYINNFLKNSNTHIVSRDAVRFSIVKKDEPYFSKEKEVFNIFIKEIKNSLKNNEVTIADATHINLASRTKLLRALGSSLKGVTVEAIVLKAPLNVCLQRNAKRKDREYVPEEAIITMYHKFENPIEEEGFNKITYVNNK